MPLPPPPPSPLLTPTEKSWLIALGAIVAAPIVLYTGFLAALSVPWVQRGALYANAIHTAWWPGTDLVDGEEEWGFCRNQVTPFKIETLDGEVLFAWHVLPRAVYAEHENELLKEEGKGVREFKDTLAYKLLVEDAEANLVINFHGNAGHLLQNVRSTLYHSLTSIHSKTHLICFSYRGFARSTGSPTELGLVTDGISVVSYALKELNIPPSRIALVGESLGTAVASSVAAWFSAAPATDDIENANADGGERAPLLQQPVKPTFPDINLAIQRPIRFGTLVLLASFPSMRLLLPSYRIGGIFPILAPLSPIPPLQRFAAGRMREVWDTRGRLCTLAASSLPSAQRNGVQLGKVDIRLLHAVDDWDIPYRMSEANYEGIKGALESEDIDVTEVVGYDNGNGEVRRWIEWEGGRVELRIQRKGAHNEINAGSAPAIAVMKGLGLVEEKL